MSTKKGRVAASTVMSRSYLGLTEILIVEAKLVHRAELQDVTIHVHAVAGMAQRAGAAAPASSAWG